MLVALDGERVIANGIIELERAERYNHRKTLTITVLREFFGRGVDSCLMEVMIDFASERRLGVLSLKVRSNNLRAVSLYKKYCFARV